jgi:hypothetical protein
LQTALTWGGFEHLAPHLGDDFELPVAEVEDEWLWCWRAWWRLHNDRPWYGGGMAAAMPGRIPWAAVRAWCDFHGYTGEAVVFLDAVFAGLDGVFFEHHSAKVKAAQAAAQ